MKNLSQQTQPRQSWKSYDWLALHHNNWKLRQKWETTIQGFWILKITKFKKLASSSIILKKVPHFIVKPINMFLPLWGKDTHLTPKTISEINSHWNYHYRSDWSCNYHRYNTKQHANFFYYLHSYPLTNTYNLIM